METVIWDDVMWDFELAHVDAEWQSDMIKKNSKK